MSLRLKVNTLDVKKSDGSSVVMNALLENSTEDALQQIEDKKEEVLDAIPPSYTEFYNHVDQVFDGMIVEVGEERQIEVVTTDDLADLDFTADYDELENKPIDRINNKVLSYSSNILNGQLRNVHFSDHEPTDSDGEVGDIWIVYEA